MRLHLLLLVLTFQFISTIYSQPSKRLSARKAPIRQSEQVSVKKYALIVGISKYEQKTFDSLKYADKDALSFYNFLKKEYIRDFDTNNIKLVINEEATHLEIIKVLNVWLDSLNSLIDPDDEAELYIYWSGHGLIGFKDQFLLCQDTKISSPALGILSKSIDMTDFKHKIGKFATRDNIRVFLIIDACRKNIVSSRPDQKIINEINSPSGTGELFLYASSCDGYSYETDKLIPGGVFTHFLLLGLEGGADRDTNGIVTYGELSDFLPGIVNDYVARYLTPAGVDPYNQNPQLVQDNQLRRIVITHLPLAVATRNKKIADSIRREMAAPVGSNSFFLKKGGVTSNQENLISAGNMRHALRSWSTNFAFKDTVGNLYDSVLYKIESKDLIRPNGSSAYDYYLELYKRKPVDLNTNRAKNLLVVALLDTVQNFIENYLLGTFNNLKKKDLDLMYEELKIGLKLKNEPIRSSYKVKLDFLKSRALASSNNPHDWNKAISIIDSAMKAMPNAPYLYHTLGMLFQNKSRYFTAAKYFDSALLFAPEWLYPQYNLATTFFQLQEYEKSIDYCKKLLIKDSSYSRVYSWLGYNYETINDNKQNAYTRTFADPKDYQKAIDYNNKALTIDSSNTYAYLNLGRIYSKLSGNYSDNLKKSKYYFSVGGLKYSDSQCLTWLGKLYEGTGIYDTAEYYYKEALDINRFDTAALDNYAFYLFKKGMTQKADSVYLDALKYTMNNEYQSYDYKFYSKYRSFVFKTKSSSFADSIFHEIILINKEDPYIFIQHSQQYADIDSLLKAKSILLLGMEKVQNSPSLNYAMAQLHFKNYRNPIFGGGALDTSLFYLYRLQQLSPNYSLLNYALSQVYLAKKNSDSAKKYLEMANSVNHYVYYTINFNRDLQTLGDSALNKRNYAKASLYYKDADSLSNYERNYQVRDDLIMKRVSENKLISSLNVARSFYLNNLLDSAYYYCLHANDNISRFDIDEVEDSSYFEMQQTLLGLIEIDTKRKKSYKKAIEIFNNLDYGVRIFPNFLEQAVCYYALGDNKVARSKAISRKENSIEAYKKMISLEGTYYSSHFISLLRALITEIGPSFFERENY